ncbi:CENP-L ortholog Fta1 [Schizosaccharomyces pombe]|uniref:Inner kinetochore subunit fta1 n=1 Tax=Schizosaccharomyces pombe (strain 972 / ATCC 24843) TaxID=284812 RepID=CENPL_SCHPO|nr:kinetochore protein fta1 [Schizosaccharomyces pombe]O36024.1 RecName: Full=Inner kinetochore subunit fta1; AltName: Full=CENP-L homolog; AltName: Full=Constitutive centromere-associated network protein fta1; AltName: Full=Sim4 complex subunit fta1; AltName: Full=Sim4-mal2-associated protein 1 [Schizosaccharomyces pombe 972h-]CAB11715.1 CENP-L homolog Fta1 [Schizosaccharomyces pombe]|eukprot:NP_594755.1 kinetochore protein fta1 [Schizosaccharomyces pombe]
MTLRDHHFYNVTYTAYRLSPLFGFEYSNLTEIGKKLTRFLRYGTDRTGYFTNSTRFADLIIEKATFTEFGNTSSFPKFLKLDISYETSSDLEVKRKGQMFFFESFRKFSHAEADRTRLSLEGNSVFFSLALVRMDGALWMAVEQFLQQEFDTQILPCLIAPEILLEFLKIWQNHVNSQTALPLELTWTTGNPNLSSVTISIRPEDLKKIFRSSSFFYPILMEHIKRCTSLDLTNSVFSLSKVNTDCAILTSSGKLKIFSKAQNIVFDVLLALEPMQLPEY